jgi:hypothetical protein
MAIVHWRATVLLAGAMDKSSGMLARSHNNQYKQADFADQDHFTFATAQAPVALTIQQKPNCESCPTH